MTTAEHQIPELRHVQAIATGLNHLDSTISIICSYSSFVKCVNKHVGSINPLFVYLKCL